jgi:hypothetical protein
MRLLYPLQPGMQAPPSALLYLSLAPDIGFHVTAGVELGTEVPKFGDEDVDAFGPGVGVDSGVGGGAASSVFPLRRLY